MRKIIIAVTLVVALAPAAQAEERVGDAALGALSGAVVLGPVGAVAGAVVGYTAGPSIASSWGLRRSAPPRQKRSAVRPAAPTTDKLVPSSRASGPALAQGTVGTTPQPQFRDRPVQPSAPAGSGLSPVQPLE